MRIDDAITNYPKATLKSLSKPVAMAFNRLKQTVKKDMKDDAFASMIEEFRKNPIEEEEEVEEEESESEYSSESESNSESESESESDSSEESSNDYSEEGSSSDESSSSEESSSDEESSDEDEDDSDDNSSYYSYSSDSFASDSSSSDSEMEVNPKLTGRAKWVLQPKDIEKAKRKEEERLKKLEEKEDEVKVEDTYETPEKLVKALLQVLAARHRVPERRANVLQLQKLLPFARALGPKYELRVLSHLVCLQLAGVNSDAAMPAAQWAACLANVTRMVRVMISHQR